MKKRISVLLLLSLMITGCSSNSGKILKEQYIQETAKQLEQEQSVEEDAKQSEQDRSTIEENDPLGQEQLASDDDQQNELFPIAGKWLFSGANATEIWEFDGTHATLTRTSLFGEELATDAYEILESNGGFLLQVNEDTYLIEKSEDGISLFHGDCYEDLLPYDDPNTQEIIELETMYQNSLTSMRDYEVNGFSGPVPAITLSLCCQNGETLENVITMEEKKEWKLKDYEIAAFTVNADLIYEFGQIRMDINEDAISDNAGKEFAIGYYHEEGPLILLDTESESKPDVLTAPFYESGTYVVIDVAAYQKAQNKSQRDQKLLTPEMLKGAWVGRQGFMCEYADGILTDFLGQCYPTWELRQDNVNGFVVSNGKVKIVIQVIDHDTICLDGAPAYRSTSRQGANYIKTMNQLAMGVWQYDDGKGIHQVRLSRDKVEILSTIDHEEGINYGRGHDVAEDAKRTQTIELKDCKLIYRGKDKTYTWYMRHYCDELDLHNAGDTMTLAWIKAE